MTGRPARARAAGEALAGRLVGLSEQDAQALADTAGLPLRAVERHGEAVPLRADLRPGRPGVTVRDGPVTAVRVEREPRGG